MLEQKVAQRTAQLQEAVKKEKHLNEMKSNFVSMASHEFRTPLSTIMSSATLIARYEEPIYTEKRNKHIERIKTSVRNLTSILNDFLSLEKLEDGNIQLRTSRFDLEVYLNEVIDEMRGIAKTGQSIIYTHKSKLKEASTDQLLLRNAIHNLLSNAIKYSPTGDDILVNSSLDKNQITIEVIDHGIGIPEEEQAHLFERFFRAHNAAHIQGTGLGLNILQQYVELMQGHIKLKSTENKGTTFTIILTQK